MRDARATAFQSPMKFLGSARVSRAGFGVPAKTIFPKVRAGETPAPTRETRALPDQD
jgi:hypothetical protein